MWTFFCRFAVILTLKTGQRNQQKQAYDNKTDTVILVSRAIHLPLSIPIQEMHCLNVTTQIFFLRTWRSDWTYASSSKELGIKKKTKSHWVVQCPTPPLSTFKSLSASCCLQTADKVGNVIVRHWNMTFSFACKRQLANKSTELLAGSIIYLAFHWSILVNVMVFLFFQQKISIEWVTTPSINWCAYLLLRDLLLRGYIWFIL